METTTLSTKYQLVSPKAIREAMHLKPGQRQGARSGEAMAGRCRALRRPARLDRCNQLGPVMLSAFTTAQLGHDSSAQHVAIGASVGLRTGGAWIS
jgi:hypothetical protein